MSLKLWSLVKSTRPVKTAGTYAMTVTTVAHIGMKEEYDTNQLYLGLTTAHAETVGKLYWMDMDEEKALAMDLKALCDQKYLDKEFDLFDLLGCQAMVEVEIENDGSKCYPVIKKMLSLKKPFHPGNVKFIKFSFDHRQQFSELPKWLQNLIRSSSEWNKSDKPN